MATRPDEVTPDDLAPSYVQRRQDGAVADVDSRFSELLGAVAPGGSPIAPEAEAPAPEGGSKVTAVVKDVGRGAVELPRAVAGGTRDAAQNTFDATGDLWTWMRDKLGLPDLTIGTEGITYYSRAELAERKRQGEPDSLTNLQLPDIEDPKSVTGQMAKGVTQFIVGFVGAGKLTGLKGASSVAGRVAQAFGKGAISDALVFDPHEERLSNLVQQFPALRNPVTDYLSADPDDSGVEGRFKNALEGMGLGGITEGFGKGLKTLRAMRLQRLEQSGISELAADGSAAVTRPLDAAELDVLGTPDAPAVTRANTQAGQKVRKALEATGQATPDAALKPAAGDVFINFRRIESEDDVKNALASVADAYKKDVDVARRNKITFAETKLSAEQVDAWDTLMQRRKGEPLNAEQSVAARTLWVSSGTKLQELAQLASAAPSEANLFAFRKMLATHYAVQNEVIAARTETARALASWRIPVGGGQEMTRALQFTLEQAGGSELSREMAERISRLSQAGYSRELDQFVRGSVAARTKDAMLEAWINGLLSGPKTHIVNMLSNSSVAFMQMYERAAAAKIGSAMGDGGVAAGEAMAQWSGLVDGLKDAFVYAGKSFKTGETGFGLGKVDVPNKAAISSDAFGLSSSGWLGRTIDVLANNVVRLPSRALAAEDEFFKTIGYRMELRAQAVRQATADVHAGLVPADGLKGRIAELIENPPESVRLAAVDQATYQTFTNAPGALTKSALKMARDVPAMRIILPFIRTPANIMRYTFERTPLAPLMKQVRADVSAGGARRDLALARMGTGTAIMLTTADMAMSGQITGGGPASSTERQALQRTGWQPYSVKVGDRYFAYNRLDPIGMVMGLSADMVEILANGDEWKEGAEADEIAIAAVAAIGNNTMSKSYLSGLSDFFEAMSDPKRSSESYAQRLAGSLVPTGVAEIARQTDPYMHEVRSWTDAIRARTPGLSSDLPVRRDLWGRPLSYQSGMGMLYDVSSPIYSRKENPEPIDKEMLRLESTASMPRPKASFDGVTVDLTKYPGVYSRYVELAGNALKHPAWEMGAKDFLNAVVSGKHELSEVYRIRSDGPDGGKDLFIRDTIQDYQQRARAKLLEEFPDLRRDVADKQSRARALSLQATTD
jgi:hypothetical protein